MIFSNISCSDRLMSECNAHADSITPAGIWVRIEFARRPEGGARVLLGLKTKYTHNSGRHTPLNIQLRATFSGVLIIFFIVGFSSLRVLCPLGISHRCVLVTFLSTYSLTRFKSLLKALG